MLRLDGFASAVTLANFPCHDSVPGWSPRRWYDQWAHVCWSDGDRWHVRVIDRVPAGAARTFTLSDLPAEIGADDMPSLFLHPEKQPDKGELPHGDHMESAPSWRGNLCLRGQDTSVSYQGEYPSAMTRIPTGTLLSLGPMLQLEAGVSNKFILVNLRKNPARDETPVRLLRLADGHVLRSAMVRYNSCSVVDMDGLDVSPDDIVAVTAAHISGIPIYLSHDESLSHLSLEHTHPPAEFVNFGDRIAIQQHMKRFYIGQAEGPSPSCGG